MIFPLSSMSRCTLLVGGHALIFLAMSGAQAQQGLTSPDAVLKRLNNAEAVREQKLKSGLARTYEKLSKAVASDEVAIGMYMDAVRMTQFAGSSQESDDWNAWKDREGAMLKSSRARRALKYQIQLTLLTLQNVMGQTRKQLMPELLTYVTSLESERDSLTSTKDLREAIERSEKRDAQERRARLDEAEKARQFVQRILDEPISDGVIAKSMMIDGELAKAKGWPKSAGATDEIYDLVILPEFRRNKDPRIFSYWEDKIEREAAKAEEAGTSFARASFGQLDKPRLVWARAQDYLAYGDTKRAIADMIGVIEANPLHPDVPDWIKDLRKTVSGEETSAEEVTTEMEDQTGSQTSGDHG